MDLKVKLNQTNFKLGIGTSIVVDSAVWGQIIGTLADQSDLNTVLNAKMVKPSLTDNYIVRADGTNQIQNSLMTSDDYGETTISPTVNADFGLKVLNAIKSGAYGAYLQNCANGLKITSNSGSSSTVALIYLESSQELFKLDGNGKLIITPKSETSTYLPKLDTTSKGLNKILMSDASGNMNWKDISGLVEKTSIHPDDLLIIADSENSNLHKKIKASRLVDGGTF